MRPINFVLACMLGTTLSAKKVGFSSSSKDSEEWKDQGHTIPTKLRPLLNVSSDEWMKPVRKLRLAHVGEVLDKGPDLKLEKVAKPEGFNGKKEKITLAPLPDTKQLPYQRYRYIQVTDNKNCSEERKPCEIEGNDLFSYRINWNLDTSPQSPYPNPKFTDVKKNKPNHWSDGGFHVGNERWTPWPSQSLEASEDIGDPYVWDIHWWVADWNPIHYCPKHLWKQRDRMERIPGVNHRTVLCGSATDDTICAYWRVGYTGYGVAEYRHDKDEEAELGKVVAGTERVIVSPNLKLAGSGIVCAANENCMQRGHSEWGNKKIRGGPQPYPFQDDFR